MDTAAIGDSPRLCLTILPNARYVHPRHAVMSPREQNHWTFRSGGVQGVNLQNAYEGTLEDLHGSEDELFPAGFGKVGILFVIKGYKAYRHTRNAQRVRERVPVPTLRRKVVEYIVEATVAYLRQVTTTEDHDGTFTFGPNGIQVQDLYLLELRRFGK